MSMSETFPTSTHETFIPARTIEDEIDPLDIEASTAQFIVNKELAHDVALATKEAEERVLQARAEAAEAYATTVDGDNSKYHADMLSRFADEERSKADRIGDHVVIDAQNAAMRADRSLIPKIEEQRKDQSAVNAAKIPLKTAWRQGEVPSSTDINYLRSRKIQAARGRYDELGNKKAL